MQTLFFEKMNVQARRYAESFCLHQGLVTALSSCLPEELYDDQLPRLDRKAASIEIALEHGKYK